MSFSIGIGIVTYNRKDILGGTIDHVCELTRHPDVALVVADDGSTDGTLAMLREKQIAVITGINMGIAWNKNRALFLLSQRLGCETVILLEDDTQPCLAGWEFEWMQAARRWGHVNFAGDWLREYFVAGSGTAEDPRESKMVTAQCASYASTALTYAGYFDPRFTGYGHEHVEHTRRLIRHGYGGTDGDKDGTEHVLYKLIEGGLNVVASNSHFDELQERNNQLLAMELIAKEGYRAPWCSDSQLQQFRCEVENALSGGHDRFRLTSSPTPVRQPADPTRFSPIFRPA